MQPALLHVYPWRRGHFARDFKGDKISRSRGAAVEVPYFLKRCDPDPVRFYPATPSLP